MKFFFLALSTLCLVNRFSSSSKALDDFNPSYLAESASLSANVAQNTEIVPRTAEDYLKRGVFYATLGQTEKALADFNQALSLDPKFPLAYYNRALLYYQSEQTQKAIEDFNQAILLNPNYAEAYGNRGITYYQLGNISQCKKDLEKASSLFEQQGNIQGYQKIKQFLEQLP